MAQRFGQSFTSYGCKYEGRDGFRYVPYNLNKMMKFLESNMDGDGIREEFNKTNGVPKHV